MSRYRYKDIEIEVIEQDGRYATVVPVSEEAIRLFTLDDGKIKIPIDLLQKIFTDETKTIRGIGM